MRRVLVGILSALAVGSVAVFGLVGNASAGASPGTCTGPLTLQESYLCNPAMHRGLKTVKDKKYAFEVPVPRFQEPSVTSTTVPGWVFARDKQPVADSADLFMWDGNANGQTDSVSILVCPATKTVCPQDPPVSNPASRTVTELDGAPAQLLKQPNMQCAMKSTLSGSALEAKCGFEYLVIARRGQFTYIVVGQPYVPRKQPTPEFERVIHGWRWIGTILRQPSAYGALHPYWVHMASVTTGWGLNGRYILRTIDGGKRWRDVTPGGDAASLGATAGADFVSATAAWVPGTTAAAAAAGSAGVSVLLHTVDGGKHWTAVRLPMLAALAQVDFLTATRGWVLLGFGAAAGHVPVVLAGTTDGGAHWTILADTRMRGLLPPQKPAGLPQSGIDAVTFATASDGWLTDDAVDNDGTLTLYVTRDGGREWAPVRLRGLSSVYGSAGLTSGAPTFHSVQGLLPVCKVGVLWYRTENGGLSWVPGTALRLTSNQLTCSGLREGFTGATGGWVAGQRLLYVTADGGVSWAAVTPDINLAQVTQFDFVNDSDGWAVGSPPMTGSGPAPTLWRTTDGGRVWHVVA